MRYIYLIIWNLRVQNTFTFMHLADAFIAFKVQMKFLSMHITNQKIKYLYIYGRKFTKYHHGTWSSLMIFVIKEKFLILNHKIYCWLLLQIYPCYLWLVLCYRVTFGSIPHLTLQNGIDYQFSSEKELELPESESASVNPSKSQSALEPLSSSSSEMKFWPDPKHVV